MPKSLTPSARNTLRAEINKAREVARLVRVFDNGNLPPIVETDNKTYRLESIRCGKEKCKCVRGKLHGPYWYSYTRVKDKVTSQYIGKKPPKDVGKKMLSNSIDTVRTMISSRGKIK